MRIPTRLVISLVIAVTTVSVLSAVYEARDDSRQMRDELARGAATLSDGLEQASIPFVERREITQLEAMAQRFANRERLAGFVITDKQNRIIAATAGLPPTLQAAALARTEASAPGGDFLKTDPPIHIFVRPIEHDSTRLGTLAIFHDARFIDEQRSRVWRNVLMNVLVQIAWIVPITLLLVRWSFVGPISRTATWVRSLRTGQRTAVTLPDADVFKPLAREVTHLVNSLEMARAVASEEARL